MWKLAGNPFFRLAALALVGIFFQGCASIGSKPVGVPVHVSYSSDKLLKQGPHLIWPDEKLPEAFTMYWDLRLNGWADKAFLLEVPYFQEVVNISRYKLVVVSNTDDEVYRIKIQSVIPQTDKLVEVRFGVFVKAKSGKDREWYVVEKWVNVREKWHHVFSDPIFFSGVQ